MSPLWALLLGAASADGLPLPLNRDLVTEVAGPDVACLKGQDLPDAPATFVLPVQAPATGLTIDWVSLGGRWQEPGTVATVTVTWDDGQTTLARAVPGQQVGSGVSSGRQVQPVSLGTGADGAPVEGVRWSIALGSEARGVEKLTFASRNPKHAICVARVATVATPPVFADPAPTAGYPFVVSGVLDGTVPNPLPVEAPAGQHGFVRSGPDGHFRFDDGTRARFWGINAVGEASIPAHDDADAYAQTLASMGFNLIRIHHFDGPPPRGLLNPARKGDADLFDPKRLDDLDWFVSRLKAHGVYLLLEVATERELTAADGVRVPGGMPNGHKLAPMWEDDWNDAYLRWFERMWGRTNPYTGLRYGDDPAVALVELSNEHSLLLHWGFGLERLPAPHLAALDARWNAFLRGRYADDASIAAAWAGDANGGLLPGESLTGGTMRREPLYPAMLDRYPLARRRDLYEFYAGLERSWFEGVEAKARSLGFRVPVLPSISYDQPILQQLQQPWKVQDIHVQYDPMRGQSTTDAHSVLAFPEEVLRFTVDAVEDRAMLITELSHPFPNPYRAEGPLLWASLGSLQDWDALVWFSYADTGYLRDTSRLAGSFDLRSTAVNMVQMPAASALFRSGGVPAATQPFDLSINSAANVLAFLQPETHARPPSALPWEVTDPTFVLGHRIRTVFDRAPRSAPSPAPGPSASLRWDEQAGVLVVDTPSLRARIGPPDSEGGVVHAPDGLDVELTGWASVALAALDGAPLGATHRALLTVATTQSNVGQETTSGGRELVAWGLGPARLAPARGRVVFAWPVRPVVLALDAAGHPSREVPVKRQGRSWAVTLDSATSPWFLVQDASLAPAAPSGG